MDQCFETTADGHFLGGPRSRRALPHLDDEFWRWLRQTATLGFPAPVWVRGRRYWREADLIAWERAQPARKSNKALEMEDAAIA